MGEPEMWFTVHCMGKDFDIPVEDCDRYSPIDFILDLPVHADKQGVLNIPKNPVIQYKCRKTGKMIEIVDDRSFQKMIQQYLSVGEVHLYVTESENPRPLVILAWELDARQKEAENMQKQEEEEMAKDDSDCEVLDVMNIEPLSVEVPTNRRENKKPTKQREKKKPRKKTFSPSKSTFSPTPSTKSAHPPSKPAHPPVASPATHPISHPPLPPVPHTPTPVVDHPPSPPRATPISPPKSTPISSARSAPISPPGSTPISPPVSSPKSTPSTIDVSVEEVATATEPEPTEATPILRSQPRKRKLSMTARKNQRKRKGTTTEIPQTQPDEISQSQTEAPPQTQPDSADISQSQPVGRLIRKSRSYGVVLDDEEVASTDDESYVPRGSDDGESDDSEEGTSVDDCMDDCDRPWIDDGMDPSRNHDDVYLEEEGAVKRTYIDRVYENGYFYHSRGFGQIELKEWTVFLDRSHFLEVLREYCIQEGFDLVRVKADKIRYTIECASDGCEWRLHASLLPDGHSFAIKTIRTPGHTCNRLEENPMANCEWLVGKIMDDVRANPEIPVKPLVQLILERYGVVVKERLMYKAKVKVKEEIDGAFDASYGLIPNYLDVLKQTNPGTLAHYVSTQVDGSLQFKYCFFSFTAQYRGFIKGYRPFIGVDGCHLKGHYGGVVLSAIGLDGNGEIFPIAYGVVQTESKDTWRYFFNMLKHALAEAGPRTWNFISDRQKGVERALEEVFPQSTRRICCRHLYANFRKQFAEQQFRMHFWAAADATSEHTFLEAMEKIKKLSAEAYQYLMDISLDTWATFKFGPAVCNSENTSNFVESFNSTLGLDRHKPVLTVLEEDVVSGSTSSGVHYSGVLEEWFGEHWWTGRAFVLLFLTSLIFIPASWLKDIGSLSAMSAIAVALAVAFIIIVVGITVYKLIQGSIDQPAWFPSITDFSSFCTLFTAMPVLICAYLCHYNVHSIQNELQDPSQMRSVVKTSLSLCVSIYVTTGLFGFLLFGDSTASDVLSNFDTDLGVPYSSVLNDLVRACYAGHIMLIFPIIFYPLRLNFDGLLFPKAQRALELDNIRFAFVTLGLIAIILVGAIFVPSIWVAFEFTGATAGAMLLFIFPAAVALRDSQGIATRKDKIMSVTFIVIAVFADVVAIYSDASSLVSS